VERLVLRAGGDMAVGCQVGQESLDFRRSQCAGVAQAVKTNEAFGPVRVTILGARRELADATGATEAVEQARRVREGQVAQVQTQNLVKEEGEPRVGFFQTEQGILLGLGNVLQEAAHVTVRKVAGVPFIVEENQAARPVGAAFAGTVLAEACSGHLADEVEQRRLRRCRGGKRLRRHGFLPGEKTRSVDECTSIQERRQGKMLAVLTNTHLGSSMPLAAEQKHRAAAG
jgi:hypothetical protein